MVTPALSTSRLVSSYHLLQEATVGLDSQLSCTLESAGGLLNTLMPRSHISEQYIRNSPSRSQASVFFPASQVIAVCGQA